MKLLTVFAPIAKAGVLFDINGGFSNFNLLNNTPTLFYKFKNTAAVGANIESVFIKIVNLTHSKRGSAVFGMSRLSTYFTRSFISRFS